MESAAPAVPAAVTCCPPPAGGGAQAGERPGLRLWPFVCGWLDTPAGPVPQVETRQRPNDLFGRWQMRWGLGRMRYRIAPGLYAIGNPDSAAPVLVTANYKLTFDSLRRELTGLDAWILVLETFGINVWCAAGKGTFGTDEVIRRLRASGLDQVVAHRTLILPQLGAPGVAAHQVRRESGFSVLYGPVRAADLPAFLATGNQATPAMRRVSFTTAERFALTPVELTSMLRPLGWGILLLLLLGLAGPQLLHPGAALGRGLAAIAAGLAGVVTGAVLTPLLLPWLPPRAFAAKGAMSGGVVALFGLACSWEGLGPWNGAALLLALPAVASWCAMNFTGSSTFTSPSGVEKEMRRAIPLQGLAVLVAGVLWIYGGFVGG
ncbi:mercury methylation corrinoid protein HgcA [Desulfuromonas carbonis]|uniref:mercury methylation corrinoid protein HgcA n=1 Tax=Desulfuromonas sp. DDH964 TaxID=1823759 RepID=UPI00078D02D9|nr:acetyl-CoA synthase subunit gamma [Desulfuromonas sp. DDH964]